MSAAETYARKLIESYSEEDKSEFLRLWKTKPYEMIDIVNVHWYAKTFKGTEMILDTASSLGLNYMDICQLIKTNVGR